MPGEHDARRRDDAAGDREAAQHPVARAVLERLLADARHEEDVVVDAERDEEDEREQRDVRARAREAEDHVEDDRADAERGQERQHDGRDEQHRRDDRAQQPDEDHEDDHERQRDEQPRVARGRLAQVVLDRGRPADERAGVDALDRLAQRRDDLERLGRVGRHLEEREQLGAGRALLHGPRRDLGDALDPARPPARPARSCARSRTTMSVGADWPCGNASAMRSWPWIDSTSSRNELPCVRPLE